VLIRGSQLLAVLPIYWFDEDKATQTDLYDQVASNTVSTRGYDGANPMRRDTLWIEKELVYVIAINPDNPGVCTYPYEPPSGETSLSPFMLLLDTRSF
jgi:hypothetical protein